MATTIYYTMLTLSAVMSMCFGLVLYMLTASFSCNLYDWTKHWFCRYIRYDSPDIGKVLEEKRKYGCYPQRKSLGLLGQIKAKGQLKSVWEGGWSWK